MKTIVIIPTYNEADNIASLIRAIFKLTLDIDILVIDDNSPDGTSDEILKLQSYYPSLFLLKRNKKDGLGRAYLAGFAFAKEHTYEAVVQMDADWSHSPEYLPAILQTLATNDFVIGSRYVKGGGVVNWPILRQIISRGGGLYARLILGLAIKDLTGGFNAWRATTLDKINLATIKSDGYSFQVELKAKAMRAGCSYQEVPIIFEERRLGQSKLGKKIIIEAIWRIWQIKWHLIDKKIIPLIKKHQYCLGLLLVLGLSVLVYNHSLQAGFLDWDDMEQVSNNRDISELSGPAIIKIFKSFYLGMYQPLATFSYTLEYYFVQNRPWLYHFDNLLLHLINIILVWLLTKKIFKQDNLALLSAAIFAIHPLTLESVIWVSARSTLLFVGFYLLALIGYLKYLEQSKTKYYWLLLLSFLLSLTSKTLAVSLPVVLLLLDYYRGRKLNKLLILEKIPLFALSVAFGLLAIKARHTYTDANQESYMYSWPNKVVTWLYSLGDYIEKIIVPSHLSAYYAMPEQINGWLPWNFYLVAGGFLLLLAILIKFRAKKTLIFLGLFYLSNLAPTVQIKLFSHTIIADRYAYLAGLAVIWLLALGYSKIIKARPHYKNIINIAVIAYLLMLSVVTANRTDLWQNNFIFWQRVVDQYPNDSFALVALGGAYYDFKNHDQALVLLEKAIKIDNKNADAFNKLGTIYFAKKDFKQAIDYYNKAIVLNSTKPLYFYNRACAIAELGDLEGALFDYEAAVKNNATNDQYYDIYYLTLANTKYKLQDYTGAILAYDTAISLVKNPGEAYFFRGLSKIALKNKTAGCQDISQAVKLNYKDAQKDYSKLCQ